jgi:flagellar protein FlbT
VIRRPFEYGEYLTTTRGSGKFEMTNIQQFAANENTSCSEVEVANPCALQCPDGATTKSPQIHQGKDRPVPLLIDFKSGDKIIINGAVIENAGASSKVLVHNQAAILRGREILSEEESKTPASRAYFALQCAYMFADKKEDYLKHFDGLLNDYLEACPSAKSIGDTIKAEVGDSQLYKALKATQNLIKHENKLLQTLQQDVEKANQQPAESGAEGG